MERASAERRTCVQAVSPTLFSATFNPDLLAVNLVAGFMSEALGAFGARARKAVRRTTAGQAMRRLQQFVDARFYHALPREVARMHGLHERETLTDPGDLEANDYAMAMLRKGNAATKATKPSQAKDGCNPAYYLSMGAFPRYVYPVADFMAAYAGRMTGNTGSTLGMTCCVDECVLLAALAVKLGLCSLDDVVIMGSPVHYTLFLFSGRETFWFNAKRDFLDAEAWTARGGATATEREETFRAMIHGYDRIITPFGSCILGRGPSTLAPERLVRCVERISRFLGFDPADLQAAATDPTPATLRPEAPEVYRAMEGDHPPEEIARLSREAAPAGSIPAMARYAHRSLDVPDLTIYAEAALKGYRSYVHSARVATAEDALAMVRAIPGHRSILNGSPRIALPDEVLYFETASAAERALLFYAFLAQSPAFRPDELATLAILLQEDGPEVTFCGETWDGGDLGGDG